MATEPTIAGMPLSEWRKRCDQYVAERAAKDPATLRHEGCDHAYGICSAPEPHTYRP